MTHRDDLGNVQVDFVYGNMPMQPDADRLDAVVTPSNVQNVGWTQGSLYYSAALEAGDYEVVENNLTYDIPADSHSIATTGYSNFPGFIPNYAGDGDAGLETTIPNLLRLTLAEANLACQKAYLNLFANSHEPSISGITITGKTVRVYAADANAYGDDELVGLRAGDQIWVDNNEIDFGMDPVTITLRSAVGDQSWIEFETATALEPYDGPAAGTIWAGPNIDSVVTLQRFFTPAGAIVNENRNVHVRYISGW
jgi:hypothetical protein